MLGIALLVAPSSAAAITSEQLNNVPLLDDLERSDPPPNFSSSGMGAGKWLTPAFASSRGGAYLSGGKVGYGSTAGTASAAYWKEEIKDVGNGVAVEATLTAPIPEGQAIGLFLNQQEPTGLLSGYWFWIYGTSSSSATAYLYKWNKGTPELLRSGSVVTAAGDRYALFEKNWEFGVYGSPASFGGNWVCTAFASPDIAPYTKGYAGLEVVGAGPSLHHFSAGALRPSKPQITSTSPASPGASTSPKIIGSAEAGTTVSLFTNSSCTGSPVSSGSAATFASPGIAATVAKNSTTTFYAMASNAGANSNCSSTSVTYVEDETPPAAPTFNWTQPASPAKKTSLRVAGSVESGSTVAIYSTATCTGSPVATGGAAAFESPGLATTVGENTTTTYHATATDAAGNTSACSSSTQKYVNTAADIRFEGSALSDFPVLYQCAPGRITEELDPLGSGKTVMAFKPLPTDTIENPECNPGLTPSKDPRAQAKSPDIIEDGQEFWLRTKFLIPSGFPEFSGGSWMLLSEVYGLPFAAPSPWRIELLPFETESVKGDFLAHLRDFTPCEKSDLPWIDSASRFGQWTEILVHEKFAKAGFVEEWINGVQEEFFDPATSYNPCGLGQTAKLEFETMNFSNDAGANSIRIGQYRKKEGFEPTPVYFEFVKLGKTKASVGG